MGLTEKEKFNIIKPLPMFCEKNKRGIPFLKRSNFEIVDWNTIEFSTYSHLKSTKNKNNKVLLNFQFDKTITCIYNDVFKFANKVYDFFAVTTPDYSAYINMEPFKIEENVIHSLWVGAWLQYLGVRIIPTVTWADSRTYDICFNHIEKGSVVAISTIGVSKNHKEFIEGFNEMVKRIEPSLIIVKGKLINGMKGNFIFINFEDTFMTKKNYEQLSLFTLNKIQVIGEEVK